MSIRSTSTRTIKVKGPKGPRESWLWSIKSNLLELLPQYGFTNVKISEIPLQISGDFQDWGHVLVTILIEENKTTFNVEATSVASDEFDSLNKHPNYLILLVDKAVRDLKVCMLANRFPKLFHWVQRE